jgi:light-regulated signal transduction histidine kinase (bacteriophytochrome)
MPKTALEMPAIGSGSLPLVHGVARAAIAALDPSLSVHEVLDIVAGHARELLGAERGSVVLTTATGPARKGSLEEPITDHAGRTIGRIRLWAKRSGAFSSDEQEILGQLAHLASVAIHNAETRDALRQSEDRLRTTLRERDRALAEVAAERRRLQITNAELDQFAYIASHDLRAPLRGIANLAQWIEEDLESTMREETREMLAMLRGRMHRMEALIDGILKFSRAGRVRDRVEMVDADQLVGEALDLLAPPASTTVIIQPGMPTLLTDRLGLQQVFLNLIGNAIKHGARPGGRIQIGVRDAGEYYEFFVADDGPGIPHEYHRKIWAMFQTLSPRDEVEGAGIGLAIVKKIVEARGGHVDVDSAPDQGSTFSFLWPKIIQREDGP